MTQNFVLGAGRAYFSLEDAVGNPAGYRYLGDSLGVNLGVEATNLEVYDNDAPIAEKIVDVATQVNRTMELTCQDVNGDNLSLFLIGAKSSESQGAGSVAGEALTVKQGHYYQLGEGVATPFGARDISNVVVTGTGGTPTHVETTDYTVDLAQGLLYIVPGGGIADGTAIEVDYDTAARTIELVTSTNTGAKLGWFKYVADNTEGENRDLLLPKVQMRPNGSFALKSRDTIQQMAFALSISKRANYAQAYINGAPV